MRVPLATRLVCHRSFAVLVMSCMHVLCIGLVALYHALDLKLSLFSNRRAPGNSTRPPYCIKLVNTYALCIGLVAIVFEFEGALICHTLMALLVNIPVYVLCIGLVGFVFKSEVSHLKWHRQLWNHTGSRIQNDRALSMRL